MVECFSQIGKKRCWQHPFDKVVPPVFPGSSRHTQYLETENDGAHAGVSRKINEQSLFAIPAPSRPTLDALNEHLHWFDLSRPAESNQERSNNRDNVTEGVPHFAKRTKKWNAFSQFLLNVGLAHERKFSVGGDSEGNASAQVKAWKMQVPALPVSL